MAKNANLKNSVAQVVKTNGVKGITGANLQPTILQVIDKLGGGYQFGGLVQPNGTFPVDVNGNSLTDQNFAFLAATPGTYTNFGGLVVNEGEVCVFLWDGTWTKQVTGIVTDVELSQLGQNYRKTAELVGINTGNLAVGDKNNFIVGKNYISTGETQNRDGWFIFEDYIPVNPGDTIVWNPGAVLNNAVLVIYDSNKERIDYYSANATERTIVISETNAAFIRASFALSNLANARIIVNGSVYWRPVVNLKGEVLDLIKQDSYFNYSRCLEVGRTIANNGVISNQTVSSKTKAITKKYEILNPEFKVLFKSDLSVKIALYDGNNTFISGSLTNITSGSTIDTRFNNAKFFLLEVDYSSRITTEQTERIVATTIKHDDVTVDFNYIEDAFLALYGKIGKYSCQMYNGTAGNPSNANAVNCQFIVPRNGNAKFRVVTNRPNLANCIYRYVFYEYSVDYGFAYYGALGSNQGYGFMLRESAISELNECQIVNSNCKGVAFSLYEYNILTEQYSPLRYSDFDGYSVQLDFNEVPAGSDVDKSSIFYFNDKKDIVGKLLESKKLNKLGTSAPLADTDNILNLVYFSDIHGDSENISRIMEFLTEMRVYLSGAIHLGDSVYWNFSHDNPFSLVSGAGNAIMNVIGNHDAETSIEPYEYTKTAAECYSKFLADYIANWGVTYQQNLCYYYKDYAKAKIRLIVLDCMHYDSAQATWFANALSGARALDSGNGYSVIVASHYFPQPGINVKECLFSTISYIRTGHSYIYTDAAAPNNEKITEDTCNAIDDFIGDGGKFICWLCGHIHMNFVGTVNNHPNQTVFTIDLGGKSNLEYMDQDADSARVRGTKTQDAFNVITFDTDGKMIKILRIGGEYDLFYRHRTCLCYNYDTKTVISAF